MSKYPLCDGCYYGVNYGQRGIHGVPAEEQPANFVPPGTYPSNDLSWYANIPVPTSYMAMGSHEDFHGGYDHRRSAGVVLIADHHIAPGKKQWTWGNHPSGYAWDRNLTDAEGPYIELMSGVYTDNQPDFVDDGTLFAPALKQVIRKHIPVVQELRTERRRSKRHTDASALIPLQRFSIHQVPLDCRRE